MVLKKIMWEGAVETKRLEDGRYLQKCSRCDYWWKSYIKTPKICPQCHSPYWNKERVLNIKEERRAKIRPRSPQFSPTHPPEKVMSNE